MGSSRNRYNIFRAPNIGRPRVVKRKVPGLWNAALAKEAVTARLMGSEITGRHGSAGQQYRPMEVTVMVGVVAKTPGYRHSLVGGVFTAGGGPNAPWDLYLLVC